MKTSPKPRVAEDTDDLMESLMGGPSLLSPFAPVITIRGEVDAAMAGAFRTAVDKLKYQRRSEVAMLEINSIGGSIFAGFEMVNIMKASGMDWITYNASHAFSVGALLLSEGSPGARFMSPMASALIHGMSTGISFQGIDEVSAQVEHDVFLNDMLLDAIAKNCSMSLVKLKKIIKDSGSRDLWLTPQQALDTKLVDKISVISLDPVQGFELTVDEPSDKKPSKGKK
jgi:ATP-dependent protease ClpP protease subunit